MYGTDDPAHPGVRYLLSRPTGLIGGLVVVLPVSETHDCAASPREDPSKRPSAEVDGLIGLATAEGLGCIEGTGDSEGALLGTHPVSVRHAPGRDAFLHAIVLKNHGAREGLPRVRAPRLARRRLAARRRGSRDDAAPDWHARGANQRVLRASGVTLHPLAWSLLRRTLPACAKRRTREFPDDVGELETAGSTLRRGSQAGQGRG